MSNPNPKRISIRNHLSRLVRLRKLIVGLALLALSLYVLFGPRIEGGNVYLTLLMLAAAFIAFGLGWVWFSHGLMGWSRQFDFDFEKNEARQISASILGRSRPYVVPFSEIVDFVIKEGPVRGEGGLTAEALIEMKDPSGRPFMRAGMFDSRQEAEEMVTRIKDAVAMARQQADAEGR
ncbi:hypothetical protein SAMN04515647_2276 [Cohaesibacter sp. ES.047]|uniref:hypothetical protein n=1 Tax=Cohaesibacter sp. ES.047 TaxID=1798205 RepID=UPI000BB80AF7|nr:hypothetical protein [Cohaesibacter sp. ES.047]SNY92026.1 hypothetical protein SAMN04515647_2276 [Cohaesibacter sp. ES.047]